MKRRKRVNEPANPKATTGPSGGLSLRKGAPSVKVNKLRRAHRGKAARAVAAAARGTESSSGEPSSLDLKRANRKRLLVADKEGQQIASTEPESKQQEDDGDAARHLKVNRALKKLHIDFKEEATNVLLKRSSLGSGSRDGDQSSVKRQEGRNVSAKPQAVASPAKGNLRRSLQLKTSPWKRGKGTRRSGAQAEGSASTDPSAEPSVLATGEGEVEEVGSQEATRTGKKALRSGLSKESVSQPASTPSPRSALRTRQSLGAPSASALPAKGSRSASPAARKEKSTVSVNESNPELTPAASSRSRSQESKSRAGTVPQPKDTEEQVVSTGPQEPVQGNAVKVSVPEIKKVRDKRGRFIKNQIMSRVRTVFVRGTLLSEPVTRRSVVLQKVLRGRGRNRSSYAAQRAKQQSMLSFKDSDDDPGGKVEASDSNQKHGRGRPKKSKVAHAVEKTLPSAGDGGDKLQAEDQIEVSSAGRHLQGVESSLPKEEYSLNPVIGTKPSERKHAHSVESYVSDSAAGKGANKSSVPKSSPVSLRKRSSPFLSSRSFYGSRKRKFVPSSPEDVSMLQKRKRLSQRLAQTASQPKTDNAPTRSASQAPDVADPSATSEANPKQKCVEGSSSDEMLEAAVHSSSFHSKSSEASSWQDPSVSASSTSTTSSAAAGILSDSLPTGKRPRGRPRSSVKKIPSNRARGRPKGSSKVQRVTVPADQLVKRKRGRPRKSVDSNALDVDSASTVQGNVAQGETSQCGVDEKGTSNAALPLPPSSLLSSHPSTSSVATVRIARQPIWEQKSIMSGSLAYSSKSPKPSGATSPLALLRKKQRRRMKKSRWAQGKISKQTLLNLKKACELKNQSSEPLSDIWASTVVVRKQSSELESAVQEVKRAVPVPSSSAAPASANLPESEPPDSEEQHELSEVKEEQRDAAQVVSSTINSSSDSQPSNQSLISSVEPCDDQSTVIPTPPAKVIPDADSLAQQQSKRNKIRERKHLASCRELQRLRTDEGVQKILSWREKKRSKPSGLLLRSRSIADPKPQKETEKAEIKSALETKTTEAVVKAENDLEMNGSGAMLKDDQTLKSEGESNGAEVVVELKKTDLVFEEHENLKCNSELKSTDTAPDAQGVCKNDVEPDSKDDVPETTGDVEFDMEKSTGVAASEDSQVLKTSMEGSTTMDAEGKDDSAADSGADPPDECETSARASVDREVDSSVEQRGKSPKRAMLSLSSSLDSEDGQPPKITEVTPLKDNRSDGLRCEELSPPPLIRPDDLYSEDYFLSLPGASSLRTKEGKVRALASETAVSGQLFSPISQADAMEKVSVAVDDAMPLATGDSDIKADMTPSVDAPMAESGAIIASGSVKVPVFKKKRGRPAKRKRGPGPASRTGKPVHTAPPPPAASSKPVHTAPPPPSASSKPVHIAPPIPAPSAKPVQTAPPPPAARSKPVQTAPPPPAASSKPVRKPPPVSPTAESVMPKLLSTPHTFTLRPKSTRSPIEILALRRKQEEKEYELEEATRLARKLKRKQAHYAKLGIAHDPASQQLLSECKPCFVVLVDFVKKLHLNSIDTSDEYTSDVSYDSDEKDVDYEFENYPEDDYHTAAEESEEVSEMEKAHKTLDAAFEVKAPTVKSAPDLESFKGKGFIGNFVDFIQNRNTVPHVKSTKRSARKMVHPGVAVVGSSSLTSVATPSGTPPVSSVSTASLVAVSAECTESTAVKAAASAEYTASTANQVASSGETSISSANRVPTSVTCSEPTASESLTFAEVHTSTSSSVSSAPGESSGVSNADVANSNAPPVAASSASVGACLEDKIVSSSPTKAAEPAASVCAEKTQGPALMKPLPEKGGKLKVFPVRKETESGAAERAATSRYLCSKCDFSATNKETIESHVYRHIPGVSFKCGYCDSEFTGLVSALTHVKNSHGTKEPMVWISKDINEASLFTEEAIVDCGESQPSTAELADGAPPTLQAPAVHESPPVIISLVMSGDRPVARHERFSSSPLATQRRFACTHCSYSTNVVEDAHQHVRDLHEASRLYTCYLCDKAFACSLQEAVAHCSATHPHRPTSYKRLPDFYDQELLRVSAAGAGDRPKLAEDRGNIFDRMSNLFPNLGPGGDVEDGPLSPQARYLRARDYLYVQEGLSQKTSAEADSTTIEDIEMPMECGGGESDSAVVAVGEEPAAAGQSEGAPVPLPGSSNETLSHPSAAHPSPVDAGVKSPGHAQPLDTSKDVEADAGDAQSQSSTLTPGDVAGGSCVESEVTESTSSQQSDGKPETVSSESAEGLEEQKELNEGKEASSACPTEIEAGGEESVVGEENIPATSDGPASTESGEKADSQPGPSLLGPTAGPQTESSEGEARKEMPGELDTTSHQPSQESADETGASSAVGVETVDEAGGEDAPSSQLASESVVDEVASGNADSAAPVDEAAALITNPDPDLDDEDGETDGDMLVINLDEDVLNEADDTSDTPEDEKVDAALMEAEGKPSDLAETSALDADNDDNDDDDDDDNDTDNSMGIKILSVVSLRDGANAIPGISHSPVKSPQPSGSQSDVGSPQGPSSQDSAPAESSPATPQGKGAKGASGGVDADDMAARHERMVCTYKCQSCNVHSPALSAIVEHLKQHHHDIPLFSCPYCRVKKDVFFTEEQVHGHVIEYHPSNYAKNEVSLSERAKSFVQVLALPSGRNSRGGGLIEQDIYMCLRCETHVPDVDYALRHLRLEHPGLVKYVCPACGVFAHGLKEAVKAHVLAEHGLPDIQLSLAMEGVFLKRIATISQGGKYCDHAPSTTAKPSPKKVSPAQSLAAQARLPGSVDPSIPLMSPSAVPIPVTLDPAVVAAAAPGSSFGLVQVDPSSPFMLAPVHSSPQRASPRPMRKMRPGRSLSKLGCPQMPRPILPVPSPDNSKTAAPRTVREILDKQRGGEGSQGTDSTPTALTVSVTQAQGTSPSGAAPDTLSPRRIFPMTDRLDRLGRSRRSVSPHGNSPSSAPSPSSPAASSTSSSPSRPVLKVPQVSSILNLSSPTRGGSVDTVVLASSQSPAQSASKSLPLPVSVSAASLPFSVASLTAPVVTTASSAQHKPATKRGSGPGEDPEAFQIFNLKPRLLSSTQAPSPSLRPVNPVTQTTTTTTPQPRTVAPPNAVVTMASSALFPQQFRLQQYQPSPPVLQPAGIGTLPIGQGGLPIAQNVAFPLSLPLPLPLNPTQLLMAPNPLGPLILPAEILSQLNIAAPHLPQLQGVPIVPAMTQQPQRQGQGQREQVAAVNLSLGSQGLDKRPAGGGKDRPTTAPPIPGDISRRGRPRLNPTPRATTPGGDGSPRPLAPRPQAAHSSSPTSGSRVRQGASHDCMCPYCLVTLRPWEVAQHIKMTHPGKDVKYQRK